ncbi:MAG: hypothetical protein HYV63_31805 [Candidatus Schekmanbacteria bacterium]|nr:hypothetical protein [Candidatus Schekmanbacteria bacterium]
MLTPETREMLVHLRDPASFQWHVIPLFALIVYVYACEVERRNWNQVLAGVALFGMDWFNEIANGLVLHFTGRAALWTTPGHSAYVILAGWTIEIAFMFAIAGVVFVKTLPADRRLRLLGLPNRWVCALGWSVFCVFIEVLLNKADALIWSWSFWNWPNVWLIIAFGYLHFFVVAFLVHDMALMRNKLLTVAAILGVDAAATLVFGVGLRWL